MEKGSKPPTTGGNKSVRSFCQRELFNPFTPSGSAITYRMKNNRLALGALPQASTQQTPFLSVLCKMALPTTDRRLSSFQILDSIVLSLHLIRFLQNSRQNLKNLCQLIRNAIHNCIFRDHLQRSIELPKPPQITRRHRTIQHISLGR